LGCGAEGVVVAGLPVDCAGCGVVVGVVRGCWDGDGGGNDEGRMTLRRSFFCFSASINSFLQKKMLI